MVFDSGLLFWATLYVRMYIRTYRVAPKSKPLYNFQKIVLNRVTPATNRLDFFVKLKYQSSTTACLKNGTNLIFNNFNKPQPISIIFAHSIIRIFATNDNDILLLNQLWTYFTLQYLTVA